MDNKPIVLDIDKKIKTYYKHLFRGIILILIGVVMLLYMFFNNNSIKEYSKDLFYMDTYINVKVFSKNEKKANKVLSEIDSIYKDYHQLTSRYDSYQDIKNIYYINQELDINEEVEIDKDLYEIIEYGISSYDNTNGLINIAMGNVIDIWKSHKELGTIPLYDELSTSDSISINDIVLLDDNKIKKTNDVKIDLGSIAKGYVTDIVSKYLETNGFDKYIINAGGNVKVGKHYNSDVYKIGLEKPVKDSTDIYKVVKGNNISIVTSGSYERFYEVEGEIYHHIIDPNTLYPPLNMYSVTIIAEESKLADLLSTQMFLMEIEEGMEYINSLDNVEAIWYGVDEEIYYSKGFNKYE